MVVLLLSHLFLFPAAGQMVMAGQRVVGPTGGQVLMARPQGQQQGQLVRTSTGQLLMQQPQQQQLGGQTVIRQQLGGVAGSGAAAAGVAQQKVVINQPGLRPGQPGSQITVPLATLQVESRVRVRSCVNPALSHQALQPGQGIPTGTPGHLLVKTETGQYQILRTTPAAATAATAVSQQPQATVVRQAAATPPPAIRLPTQPLAPPRPPAAAPQLPTAPVSAPPAPAPASAGLGGMGQQMTPDTAKVKCRNFLATLLRLASDQPETVAKNVRELIQVRPTAHI